MNIKLRIVARKIIFCYFFEQYFFSLVGKKTSLHEEIEKIAHHMYDADTPPRDLSKVMNRDYYMHIDDEIPYIIKWFFAYNGQSLDEIPDIEVDREYIERMAKHFREYEPVVRELVNMHTVTFSFDEMDILDRVIFVLGYTEWKVINSPREVVINEMIEFGKRYGDESSFKLINGIAHKILSDEEANTSSNSSSAIDRIMGT